MDHSVNQKEIINPDLLQGFLIFKFLKYLGEKILNQNSWMSLVCTWGSLEAGLDTLATAFLYASHRAHKTGG